MLVGLLQLGFLNLEKLILVNFAKVYCFYCFYEDVCIFQAW